MTMSRIHDANLGGVHAITEVTCVLYQVIVPVFVGIISWIWASIAISFELIFWLWITILLIVCIVGGITSPRWNLVLVLLVLNFSILTSWLVPPPIVIAVAISISFISVAISIVSVCVVKTINHFSLMSTFESWTNIFIISVVKNLLILLTAWLWGHWVNVWDHHGMTKLFLSPGETVHGCWMLIILQFPSPWLQLLKS